MTTEFVMTDAQHTKVLDACKPTPVMFISGGQRMGRSPQENANDAWEALGKEMGFKSMTVKPVGGKSTKHFTAEPVT